MLYTMEVMDVLLATGASALHFNLQRGAQCIGFRVWGLGFRVQHLKSEHLLVKQLVKRWNKTPPTQETHNIEKIQSSLNTFPVGFKLKVQLTQNRNQTSSLAGWE